MIQSKPKSRDNSGFSKCLSVGTLAKAGEQRTQRVQSSLSSFIIEKLNYVTTVYTNSIDVNGLP